MVPQQPPAAISLDREVGRLRMELDAALHECEGLRARSSGVLAELAGVRAERDRFRVALRQSDARNAELVKVCVALQRLQGARGRGEVLAALSEIVVSVLGSEEFVVFEVDAARSRMVPAARCGTDPDRFPALRLGQGVIGRVALTGTAILPPAGSLAGAEEVVACVPLRAAGRTTGVLAILGLLPQKETLEEADLELLELLSDAAGQALCAAAPSAGGA